MPFYLKPTDIVAQTAGLKSVLVVPCGFCPAASLAVQEKQPYLEPFRHLFRTQVYERFLNGLCQRLEAQGIKTRVFKIRSPHHYVACMWSTRRRQKMGRLAAAYDGVVVLGCAAAVDSVREYIESSACRVVQGMDLEGVMNVIPKLTFPLNLSLVPYNITPIEESMPIDLQAGIAQAGA